jgi:hypothetical protein
VEKSKVLRLVLALEECNKGDDNQEDGDRNRDKVNMEGNLDEEYKDNEALLQKIPTWCGKARMMTLQYSHLPRLTIESQQLRGRLHQHLPTLAIKNKRQRRRHQNPQLVSHHEIIIRVLL